MSIQAIALRSKCEKVAAGKPVGHHAPVGLDAMCDKPGE